MASLARSNGANSVILAGPIPKAFGITMCSLTITDAAYSRIQRELAGSPIESPIISLVQSARATLPPYAMLRAIDPDASDSNLHDIASECYGADSS